MRPSIGGIALVAALCGCASTAPPAPTISTYSILDVDLHRLESNLAAEGLSTEKLIDTANAAVYFCSLSGDDFAKTAGAASATSDARKLARVWVANACPMRTSELTAIIGGAD